MKRGPRMDREPIWSVQFRFKRPLGLFSEWKTVCQDVNERTARTAFGKLETECAVNKRGYTEVKLFRSAEVVLYIWWNRDVPNTEDGLRDWAR